MVLGGQMRRKLLFFECILVSMCLTGCKKDNSRTTVLSDESTSLIDVASCEAT